MKKQILLGLMTTVAFVSCTNQTDLDTAAVQAPKQSVTIQKLQHLNDSLNLNYTPCFISRSWKRDLFVVAADAYGAYTYGQKGARIGAMTGTPNGVTAGAIIGGIYGAIKYSYRAYERTQLEEDDPVSNLKLNKITNLYCSLERVDESNFEYCLNFPYESKAFENAGEYHNRAINHLLEINGYEISPLSDDNEIGYPAPDPIKPENFVELTPLERNIIECEEYSTEFDADETILLANSVEDFNFGDSITGIIMQFYIDALESFDASEPIQNVVNITNDYIEIVDSSTELSDLEKENLFIAFSVGIYSYKYWSNFLNN